MSTNTKTFPLRRKIPCTLAVMRSLCPGDRVHLFSDQPKNHEIITDVVRRMDCDDDVRLSTGYASSRWIGHIKILTRASPPKTTGLHGIQISIQGNEIKIRGEIVRWDTIQAVGEAIDVLETDLSLADVVTELQSPIVFIGNGRVKRGCVDVTHEQAREIIYWIVDNYDPS